MKKIAILDSGYDSYDYERELFTRKGYTLDIYERSNENDDKGNQPEHADRRLDTAQNAEGILVRGTVIDEKALSQMPDLKAIVRYGVGYDNIDIAAAKERGIRVSNVQGYANHAVSDHALALMFSCVRDLEANRNDPFGVPSRKAMFELHDKTLGIIGIGRIGSHFSRKASPLFKETLACDPYKASDYISSHGARKTALSEILKRSHVISLHCNLTEQTRYILNNSSFGQMENRPVIINTSRGPVINEKDLLSALDHDLIHSAGLDVFEQEPPGDLQKRLMDHPGVIATQHIAWYSEYAMKELQKRAAENMIALLSGLQIEDEL